MGLQEVLDAKNTRQCQHHLQYGTAGFRGKADILDHVAFRCGLFVAMLSWADGAKHYGICITASHNPAEDNGVKLTDNLGKMLPAKYEEPLVSLINSDKLYEACTATAKFLGITLPDQLEELTIRPRMLIGRDTRHSSLHLSKLAVEGASLMGATVCDIGVVTTPMLHFEVYRQACNIEDDYFTYFQNQFRKCCAKAKKPDVNETLVFDGANGVGALHANKMLSVLGHNVVYINDGTKEGDVLNEKAGAEYVQKEQHFPKGITPSSYPPWTKCAAVDGDADRLVYFTFNENGDMILLDGDRIMVLIFECLQLGVREKQRAGNLAKVDKPLTIGICQTGYANSKSTEALSQMGKKLTEDLNGLVSVEVEFAKTGVKNLHRLADEYDIGLYWESNGHGTVLVKWDKVKAWNQSIKSDESATFMEDFLSLFNPTVGDAFSDLLAVECALRVIPHTAKEWASMVTENPCHQAKIKMPREKLSRLIPHPQHELYLIEPSSLQELINLEVAKFTGARAFIRPSGTEDVLRIYAEAATMAEAKALAGSIEAVACNFKLS